MRRFAVKLWIGMMALVAVILVLLWLFQIVFLERYYTDMRITDVEKKANVILADIGDLQTFAAGLDELAFNNNLTAELLDMEQNSVYFAGEGSSANQMPMMRNVIRSQSLHQVLKGEKVKLKMSHPRFNTEFVIIGIPVYETGVQEGALMLAMPLAPVEETVSILKKQMVFISIILLAATLLLSYILSRSFTRPIREISKVSMDMAYGNLSARIVIKRKDEIGELAKTINFMGSELFKLEQLRKDLIANVSHELRTPLSLIKGYAETIRDVSGDQEEKRTRQIGIIIEETDRLSCIVEDILKLSQMQAGYLSLNKTQFSLEHTLERVIKRFEILSEKTGVKIIRGTGKIHGVIEGDESKIEQVLYNLINNAFNHSSREGEIHIDVREAEGEIRVIITDHGEGIPGEELPYIWERFYKVDKTGSRKTTGTGLGLAIVKNILDAHQARYGVDSEPGKGSSFWFEFRNKRQ